MNKWTTGLTLSTMLAIGSAAAQNAAPNPAHNAAAQPAPAGLPNVESANILKQNQAERSRTQPGNNAPVWRAVKNGASIAMGR